MWVPAGSSEYIRVGPLLQKFHVGMLPFIHQVALISPNMLTYTVMSMNGVVCQGAANER